MNTVRITVKGGVVQDVSGLPEGWDCEIIDLDDQEAERPAPHAGEHDPETCKCTLCYLIRGLA